MLAGLIRVLLPLVICPLMGAMLGRFYLMNGLDDPRADVWGWAAGLVIGVVYALAVMVLALGGRGPHGRVAGEMILIALCALTLADLAAQLTQTDAPWLIHATAAIYVSGLLVALSGIGSSARPAPPPMEE